MRIGLFTALLLWSSAAFGATPDDVTPTMGSTFKIVKVVETESRRGDESTGSSYDRDTIIERVVAVRDDGLELEYSSPPRTDGEQGADNWQLPARVLKLRSGRIQLLNAAELEARVDPWLAKAGWTRAICDRWIFTWNAFHIDCDPASAVAIIKPFDLRPDALRNGAPYHSELALAAAPIRQTIASDGTSTFVVELVIDPDGLRRAQAETDVTVGEIMGRKVTFDDALRKHTADTVSGTMVISFETDATGEVKSRRTLTTIETVDGDGKTETRKTTETVERKREQK
ncbi:MAG: hypothetical protein ACREQF_04175 [Candidatus Binataceae bacterium]